MGKQKRDASRKKRSEHVRSLVSFVKGMDKRAMRISMQARAIAGAVFLLKHLLVSCSLLFQRPRLEHSRR